MQMFEFNGMTWTLWDRWILEGDLTVQEVLNWFQVRLKALHCNQSIGLAHAFPALSHKSLLCSVSKESWALLAD